MLEFLAFQPHIAQQMCTDNGQSDFFSVVLLTVKALHVAPIKKIHTHPMKGHQKFLGGRVVFQPSILEANYKGKLEFPWRGGGAAKHLVLCGLWLL